MRTVALAILGYGPNAEDAVQDATAVALRRIGEVRDLDVLDLPTVTGPEEMAEQGALRDWVWHAIGALSEADRLVLLLRHFSSVTSYDQIANLCGLPVGTVRSRLSHGRRKLAEALRATTDVAYLDATALGESRWREAYDVLTTAMRGDFAEVVDDMWLPEARLVFAGQVLGGRETVVQAMDRDLDWGIRQRLLNVVASEDVLLWETELINPPGDPDHCPPSAVWLHEMRQGRVRKMTLFHPQPADVAKILPLERT